MSGDHSNWNNFPLSVLRMNNRSVYRQRGGINWLYNVRNRFYYFYRTHGLPMSVTDWLTDSWPCRSLKDLTLANKNIQIWCIFWKISKMQNAKCKICKMQNVQNVKYTKCKIYKTEICRIYKRGKTYKLGKYANMQLYDELSKYAKCKNWICKTQKN